MNERTSIRPARVDEVDRIASLFWSGPVPAYWEVSARDSIAAYPSSAADVDDQLAGFAYSSEFDRETLLLENIYVAKEHRSRRIGSYLLSHIEKAAAESYREIILFNSDPEEQRTLDLPSATRFYLQRGYQRSIANSSVQVFTKSLSRVIK